MCIVVILLGPLKKRKEITLQTCSGALCLRAWSLVRLYKNTSSIFIAHIVASFRHYDWV